MSIKKNPIISHISIWWEKGQVEVEAYLIRGQINVLIDTGPSKISQYPIALSLKDFGLTLADIDLVLNTHGHEDHTGGDAVIKAAGSAQICLHGDDAIFLEDRQRCFNQYYAPPIEALRGKETLGQERVAFLETRGAEVKIDRQLTDNDLIYIGHGIELRVIHLPGHTSGSVSFYWEKEGILFSGDSVSGLHTKGGKLPIITNLAAYKKSIERLLKLPLQLLCCGHPYRGKALLPCAARRGGEIRQYLCDSLEAAQRIDEAVRRQVCHGGSKSLLQITDKVIAELPKEMGFKRVAELASPLFSARTVFWYLHQLNDNLVGSGHRPPSQQNSS